MTFDWSAYLLLARQLLQQSDEVQEANLRSAISRAYYAAFGRARNHLRDKEGHLIPRGPAAHKYVREQFERSSEPKRRKVGAILESLRLERNNADYEDSLTDLHGRAEPF